MGGTIPVVFLLVYLGMLLGGLPRLKLDRTGIALLGAIVLVASEAVTLDDALRAIDLPTITLLFGLMVVSAQLRLGGFYTRATEGLGGLGVSPPRLLALLIAGSGLLSAIFSND